MEEAKDVLGLGLSPGFKFDPEDEELVEYYLLRRILGQQLPLEGMIFEDDPLRAPPWKLLDKHKRKGVRVAFFFANGQPIQGEAGRQNRSCVGGGYWKGEKPLVDGDRLRVPDDVDSGREIAWKKYMLSFHLDGKKGSTGWVMHEYSITDPADLASSMLRLYRIRFSGHGGSAKREPDDYAQARAEPDLLQEHSSVANSVFPTVAAVDDEDGGSAWPAAPSYSDQDYQHQYQHQHQYQYVADYAGPGGASTHQDLVDGSTMNLGAHSATPSSPQGQGAPGVMPVGMLAPFGQESFSGGAIDDSFMDFDFELPENCNIDELLAFPDPFGWEAPLHDQLM